MNNQQYVYPAVAPAPAGWAYPAPAAPPPAPVAVAVAPPAVAPAAGAAADRPAANFLFILLLIQASSWLLAALADLVFGLAFGSPGNAITGFLTIGVAAFAVVLAVGITRRWRWVRRAAIVLEAVFVFGWLLGVLINLVLIHVPTALLFSDGPVTWLTDVGIPLTVIVLLMRKPPRMLRRRPQGR